MEDCLNKIIVCSHGSNVSDWLDFWYSAWRTDANEIYLLLDNCTDDSVEKAQKISEQDPHFHYFYVHYTFFRFAVIRNDLLRMIPNERALYIFPCMDQLPVVKNWKEYLSFELETCSVPLTESFFIRWFPTGESKQIKKELSFPFFENCFDGLSVIYDEPSKIFELGSNGQECKFTEAGQCTLAPHFQWFKHFRKTLSPAINWSLDEAHDCQVIDILLGQNPSFYFFTSSWFYYSCDSSMPVLIEFWLCTLIDNIKNLIFIKKHLNFIFLTALSCFNYLKKHEIWDEEYFNKNMKLFLNNIPPAMGRWKIKYFKDFL